MKILIVDDDIVSRKLLRGILAGYGHCDLAADGGEAVDTVRQSLDEREAYDLITLDIKMPDIDGQETLRQIRALEEAHGIYGLDQVKVIMATAMEDSRNIMTAFSTGCEGYLVKPFDRDAIELTIEGLFGRKN